MCAGMDWRVCVVVHNVRGELLELGSLHRQLSQGDPTIHRRWQAGDGIVAQVHLSQVHQATDLFGKRRQLVAARCNNPNTHAITRAHTHTRRQAWREYHTMRRHVGFPTQQPPTHLLKVRCSRSGKHMISGGSVVILFWYLRTWTHAHGHGRMRMSASHTHSRTAAQPQPQPHRHNTCGKPNATNMCSSRRHVMPCNRSPDKTLICSARTCEQGVCDGNMRGTAGHVHHCCRR